MKNEMNLVLVTGGIRSGKTDFSERYVLEHGTSPCFYLPTALPGDSLMETRIARHRATRDPRWKTLEIEPAAFSKGGDPREILKDHLFRSLTVEGSLLLDSLGLFVGACLPETDAEWGHSAKEFLRILTSRSHLLVVVSEEVGMALVPESPSGRLFCDRLGELRQVLANLSDEVILVVAGLPVVLKTRSGKSPGSPL